MTTSAGEREAFEAWGRGEGFSAYAMQRHPCSGEYADRVVEIRWAAWQARAAHQAPQGDERIYPCARCGIMRSKAEGGTTFTVCDKCWDAAPQPGRAPQAAAVGTQAAEQGEKK